MTKLSFGLDLRKGTEQLGLTPEGQPYSDSLQEADPLAVLRFQEALGLGTSKTPEPISTDPAQLPSGPFALFGATPALAIDVPVNQEKMQDVMRTMVGRLLVADGRDSQRSVRMELTEDMMPGVSLAMFEDGGAVVAEFECRVEASFVKLAEPAQALAHQLAVTLERDTVWRVMPAPDAGFVGIQTVEAFGYASTPME
jgi:hypothetical protein